MKLILVFALLLPLLGGCLVEVPWQPRQCLDQDTDPYGVHHFDVPADRAFRSLRAELFSQGYRVKESDWSRGYLEGRREENLCQEPGAWATSPEEGGSPCDLDWPVYRYGSVQIDITPTSAESSAVRLTIVDTYRFARHDGSVDEVSNVCPEDYRDFLDAVRLFERL